jgi:hypothetical protein
MELYFSLEIMHTKEQEVTSAEHLQKMNEHAIKILHQMKISFKIEDDTDFFRHQTFTKETL